jgi:hypothetical protein
LACSGPASVSLTMLSEEEPGQAARNRLVRSANLARAD